MSDPFRDSLMGPNDYPDRWDPQPGEVLIGQIARYEGPIAHKYSEKTGKAFIAIILDEESGKEWSVWLLETVLVNAFVELAPDPGERVGIKFVGTQTSATGEDYKKYIVRVDRQENGNPFRKPSAGQGAPPPPPPPPPARNHPSPPPPRPQDPPGRVPEHEDTLNGMFGQEPAAPRLEAAEGNWRRWMTRHRVEPWAELALARAAQKITEDPEKWGIEEYEEALRIVGKHGPPIFNAAALKLAEDEPADPEHIAMVRTMAERVPKKQFLIATEAVDTGWHEAVCWAEEFLRPFLPPSVEEEEPRPATPITEPEDDLPF